MDTKTEILDGNDVAWFHRQSMFFETDSAELLKNGTFHIYTNSELDTIYSIGLASVRQTYYFSVNVNGEPFVCKADNSITIDSTTYKTKDILRIASGQPNTGVYMLTGSTSYEIVGPITQRILNLSPDTILPIVINSR